ncbi:MAG: tRNA 2-selenouridine(34) synthase MnmH [Pseudomonadota bacterium]
MNPVSRHSIAIEEIAGGGFDAIIDVRSPSEFAEDHIPGAISCPVLDDGERARIGTLYKQVAPFEAKKAGAVLVARNVAKHIEEHFLQKPRTWRPLVYCWRGGKRSGAMAHVLRDVGWDARTLEGGYKAYRRWVVDQLLRLPYGLRFRVVCGPTGSGKSRLLQALARAGAQVLDLEALAAHRGSVLGSLPGRGQPSQKTFESLLLNSLSALDSAREIYVESESRKIGQLQVPEALIHEMRGSRCLTLDASLETRVALLTEEYRHFIEDRAALEAQLDCLAGLHGRERIAQWKALAAAGRWSELVRRLLAEHYDPAYRRSTDRNYVRLGEADVFELAGADELSFARTARRISQAYGDRPAARARPSPA